MSKENAKNTAEQLLQQEQEFQENASARINAQLQSNRAEAQQALDKRKRSHLAEAEQEIQQALDKQKRQHFAKAQQEIRKVENRVIQETEMRHREVIKHKEQQVAYLTNKEKALIAERRQANKNTQHKKEPASEKKPKKNKTESAKNLAYAPILPAGGPKAKEKDTAHSDNPETTTPPKITSGLTKQFTSPKTTPRRTPACPKLIGEKQPRAMLLNSCLQGWKWLKNPDGKIQN